MSTLRKDVNKYSNTVNCIFVFRSRSLLSSIYLLKGNILENMDNRELAANCFKVRQWTEQKCSILHVFKLKVLQIMFEMVAICTVRNS